MNILGAWHKSSKVAKDGELEMEILILKEISYGKNTFCWYQSDSSSEASLLQEINILMISALSTFLRVKNPNFK